MRYSEPLQNQLTAFLAFSGAGFLLGGVYAVCGFFRKLFGDGKKATFALDLLFCFFSFAVLFGAGLAFTNGFWRLPELAAATAGFFAFRCSLGRLLEPLLTRFSSLLRTAAERILSPFQRCSASLRQRAAASWEKRKARREKKAAEKAGDAEKTEKIWQKKKKIARKHLQNESRFSIINNE